MRLRRVDVYADWTRGKGIRRLIAGQSPFGLWRSAPGHGKTY
jgi:hypothetical protein